MKLTYKIAVNYSTVEFELDSAELKEHGEDLRLAVRTLTALAMTDDGKPSKVATSAKTTKKKESDVSENQRRWLRVHGYKDKDIDTMTSKQAYAIIAEAKKNEEAEEELW